MKKRSTVKVPLCPPQIQNRPACDTARVCTVRVLRLTA